MATDWLTPEEERLIDAFIAQEVIGEGSTVDPGWFIEDVESKNERLTRLMCFMLYYFPRDFFSWEIINDEFFAFLEYENKGMAWLPAQHGKTTMLWRWFPWVMVQEPNVSINYTEKNLPIAQKRSRACRMVLEENERLRAHWGDFRPPPESSKPWSDTAFTIRQRTELVDSPTIAVYGAGGGSLLGSRCNILVVDDPVTPENSRSEKERDNLKQWFDEAAATSPYPLPVDNHRYLVKQFLVGTVFRLDDLFHKVLEGGEYEHLYLKAVPDEASGRTLSQRFIYMDPREMERRARRNPDYEVMLERVKRGEVQNLYAYMQTNGRMAFNRRYQNIAVNEEAQWVKEVWITGGGMNEPGAPSGGYPGCIDKKRAIGDTKSGWVIMTGCDPQSGSKSRGSKNFAMVTLAAEPKDPHIFYIVDMESGQYPLESHFPGRKTQLGLLMEHADKYGSKLIIEDNAVQKGWLDLVKAEAHRRKTVVSVEGHFTGTNKTDPEVGVQSMGPMIENGYLRFPWKTPRDRRMSQLLIDELVYWGVHPTSDLVMALWFAWSRLARAMKVMQLGDPQYIQERSYVNRLDNWVFPPHWSDEERNRWLRGLEGRNA